MSDAGDRVQFGNPEFTEEEYLSTNVPCPKHGVLKPGGCGCEYFASDQAYIFNNFGESITLHYREVRQYVSEDGFSPRTPFETQLHIPVDDLPSIVSALKVFMHIHGMEDVQDETNLLFFKPKEKEEGSDGE